MPDLIFYSKPMALDRNLHAKHRFNPLKGFWFAQKTGFVPLILGEFHHACREYPIVFISDPNQNLGAVAVLSLDGKSNNFVNDKGQWTATYIPAFVRRYPFVPVGNPQNADQFAVAFDEDSGCFGTEEGTPLFQDDGKPSDFLKNQLEFMSRYHAETQRTRDFLAALKQDELLGASKIDIVRNSDQARFSLTDALMVNEAKLQTLTAERLHEYFKKGWLGAIYAHLISLQCFMKIANRTGAPSEDVSPWWTR